MFNWITSPEAWIALATLTALEIVLGIDNIIFISILSGRLPKAQRPRARTLGLAGAMLMRVALLLSLAWVAKLTVEFFTLFGDPFTARDVVLVSGGLFLLAKATFEIHHNLEGDEEEHGRGPAASFAGVIAQIMILDIVFSLDSVITAIGMAEHVPVMVAAVVIAVIVMMIAAGPISDFVEDHPTIKILALVLPAPDRHVADRGRPRTTHSETLYLLRDGLLGLRRNAQPADARPELEGQAGSAATEDRSPPPVADAAKNAYDRRLMTGVLYPLSRALLFRLDPEAAHGLSLSTIARVGSVPGLRSLLASQFSVPEAEPVEVFGLRFPNRVGLAAGYDKDGEGWRGLACLGFGHIEVGTVTPEPQPGNPKPRIFRLVEERSVINRMGFPGRGAEYVAAQASGADRPGGRSSGSTSASRRPPPSRTRPTTTNSWSTSLRRLPTTWRSIFPRPTRRAFASSRSVDFWAPCWGGSRRAVIGWPMTSVDGCRCWSSWRPISTTNSC